ncbi:hypothetical protein V1477_011989 [Vespula maculifrons]|uniref:Uncharacterized protein n=1 Tax=Vespula maculifrons TaxID=7453 RepID=A0ABD2C0U8_VESMC
MWTGERGKRAEEDYAQTWAKQYVPRFEKKGKKKKYKRKKKNKRVETFRRVSENNSEQSQNSMDLIGSPFGSSGPLVFDFATGLWLGDFDTGRIQRAARNRRCLPRGIV